MLNIEYRLKLGQDEFIIRGDYKNEKEFFNSMSFFSSLPKTAPNGATDLKLVVRETKKGKYYSLVSESEKMEFQLGQHKEGDTLYAKDWIPLYQAHAEQGESVAQTSAVAPVTVGMAPIPQVAQQQQVVQPQVQQQYVPQQVVMPQVQQVVQPQVQQQVVVPTPAATPPAQPQQAAVNPQVSAVAANVLGRFGINK